MATKESIVNDIYKAYSSNSGILFGIKEREVVTAIVEFTINRLPCQCSLLREAAKELLDLHMAEQEGMLSGKPTREQWINSVDKLSNILYPPEGE